MDDPQSDARREAIHVPAPPRLPEPPWPGHRGDPDIRAPGAEPSARADKLNEDITLFPYNQNTQEFIEERRNSMAYSRMELINYYRRGGT